MLQGEVGSQRVSWSSHLSPGGRCLSWEGEGPGVDRAAMRKRLSGWKNVDKDTEAWNSLMRFQELSNYTWLECRKGRMWTEGGQALGQD